MIWLGDTKEGNLTCKLLCLYPEVFFLETQSSLEELKKKKTSLTKTGHVCKNNQFMLYM